ncbi:hypothetical protein [Palaeococcus ferrophilus]|uniref:hypothetical protein n=1 Tax=Palaeococcus ferrophilus TaxID=83868 RepID=UPI00064EF5BB|nr:hypothetical protein [Palaeococcus ferrophilus]
MDRIKVLALVAAGLITLTTAGTWITTKDLNLTLAILTLASTIATVIMAITIYELDIAIKELNFEAIFATYNLMDDKLKRQLKEIKSWRSNNISVEKFLRDAEKKKTVQEASRTLNQVGYFVYKEFVGDWFIQEQYAGLILDSFLAMKPYLKALRDASECDKDNLDKEEKESCKKSPWFMRRFYLLLVIISYEYLSRKFSQQLVALFKDYGFKPHNPVPKEWIEEDIKKWLKRRGYKQYI